MGVSIFPPASSGGGGGSNGFLLSMSGTTNNVADLPIPAPAGAYTITLDTSDSTFDIYLIGSNGSSVGYSSTSVITASEEFVSVCIIGVSSEENLTFAYSGSSSSASSEGDADGAGAYLTSASPTSLPSLDDTTTVIGGNFASDVAINFVSGATSISAKTIVRNSSTSLTVTRPDAFLPSLNPWSIQVANPGVVPPTGSGKNELVDYFSAGAAVSWVTSGTLANPLANQAYSVTLQATDSDGAVVYSIVSGSFPGLSLNASTGVLSGTPSASGSAVVRATDGGGNIADRVFTYTLQVATGGSFSTSGGYAYHAFNSSGTLTALVTLSNVEYLIVAGAGGSAAPYDNNSGGGGGAGGMRALTASSMSAGDYTVAVGGGAGSTPGYAGSNSNFNGSTSNGGGTGGRSMPYQSSYQSRNGMPGGSGGGGAYYSGYGQGGSGIAGQGNAGASNVGSGTNDGGGGGGAGSAGANPTAGAGSSWLNGATYATGGSASTYGQAGVANTGNGASRGGVNGGSGIVIVRYPN